MVIKLQQSSLFVCWLFLATFRTQAFRVWKPTISTFPITYQGKQSMISHSRPWPRGRWQYVSTQLTVAGKYQKMSHFSNFLAIFQNITREPFLTINETFIAIFKHCDYGLCSSTVNEYIPCLDPHIGWTPDGGWYMLVLPLKYSRGKSDAFSNANENKMVFILYL